MYERSIEIGIEADPRTREEIDDMLAALGQEYEAMSEAAKAEFDTSRLTNPFGDTRIVCGDEDLDVKVFMAGIDIDGPEILAAQLLRQQGRRVDAIVAHHATNLSRPLASVEDTMLPQVRMMVEVGVPSHVAEKTVEADAAKRSRGESFRAVALAEMFDVAIIGVHAPCDNSAMQYLRGLVAEQAPKRVGELVEILKGLPECEAMTREGFPPKPVVGEAKNVLGDGIYYCLSGGWNPTPQAFEWIAKAGVGTSVMVAAPDEHRKIARDYHMNIVLFPHYPMDSLGMNLLYDRWIDEDAMEVVPCSNFTRVSRSEGSGMRDEGYGGWGTLPRRAISDL